MGLPGRQVWLDASWAAAPNQIISYRAITAESGIRLGQNSRYRDANEARGGWFGRDTLAGLPVSRAAVAYVVLKTTGPGRVSAVAGGPAISAPWRRPASIGLFSWGGSFWLFSDCTR